MKKGISLIVLIITIVVIVILATAIIINLAQTNIIGNANEATVKQNFKSMQEELNLYIADKYVETQGKLDVTTIDATTKSDVKNILKSSSKNKYIDYVIIQDGEIVILDTLPEQEKIWAMEALDSVKTASGEEIENDTAQYQHIKTGLQCYLDATNENSFVGSVWNDISGRNNNAILNGCTYSDNKVVFDGVDDWANLGKHHYPNYTYEIVLEINDLKDSHILGNWQNGGSGIRIYDSSLLTSTYINDSYNVITLNQQFDLNKKYKFTYTSNGNECKLYINGELIQTTTSSGNVEMPDLQTITAIGSNPVKDTIDSTDFFSGNVYSVRIYDRVLSEEEIKQNYNSDNKKLQINDIIYENIEIADALYEINSLDEFINFRDLVNNGNTFEGKYIELKTNIDLTSITSWTPIGTESISFKGIFNGNNHSISNLNINNETDYQGLFANNSGIIENLTIESGTIKGVNYVGAIAGSSTGVISNCINKATIETTGYHTAGICGFSSGSIEKCYNYGDVTSSSMQVAGIVGRSDGNIKFCSNSGIITGSTSDSYYVGGIVGRIAGSGKISSCYNIGEIICNGASSTYCAIAGGIVGGANVSGTTVKILYCYNTASVTGNGSHVGGIVGAANSISSLAIQYCYNTGAITSKRGNNSNNAYTGGIIGSANSSGITTKYCYNTGSVSCLSGTKYNKGIAGYNSGSISNSYVLSTLGLSVSTGGTNTSEANMKTSSFVSNLGGSEYWYLDGGYPKLMWE